MQGKLPENIIINTSPSHQRGRGTGRAQGMRILSQASSGSLRRAPGGGVHNTSCPANYCGGSSGSLTNANQPPQPFEYYSFRTPPPQLSQMQSYNVPMQHETFASQMDYNLNWGPNADLPGPVNANYLMAARAHHKNQSGKHFTKDAMRSAQSDFQRCGSAPAIDDSRFLLRQQALRDAEYSSEPRARTQRAESILEWFDRTVEAELQRRRETSRTTGENILNLSAPTLSTFERKKFRSNPLLAEASASGVDINASLRNQQDTELQIAVDKLAKAEAMCTFEGAVQAAEEAAASAPPEHVEEAAAAGAQGFEARLTSVVQQQLDTEGGKPVEVIGYVGITRPNKPKKS